ncbi:MAG: transposase [Phycisphaerae bacterium]|nr:transposase [Phycisphaerae bacterium]NIU57596.1 transposase [Phycisphaerae bacterium]NIW10660.1 transposase [Gammaproteobacteria bacterium]NIW94061.1 transposase [Phycisphaerae bacterium]
MPDIIIVLQCLSQCLDKTTLRQLSYIVPAMLAMTGRVTMLGISRWTEKGGSYRTIQRFFNSPIAWAKVNWFLIRHHLLDPEDVILIGGDESVATKSGQKTYGLDRFFSSLYGKPVPGLSFFSLSLLSVKEGTSYPVMTEQVIKKEAEKPDKKKSGKKVKKQTRRRGRPKGSKNKNRRDVELTPYLLLIQTMLNSLLLLLGVDLTPVYCVMDGAFGNNPALQMVRPCSLHLISKLRYDAALYFPYEGNPKKRGAQKKYGAKLDYDHIPDKYLKETTLLDGIQTKIYQMTMWHKLIPDKLNIVIIVKTNLKTQKVARVVLFSSDLELAFDKLIDYYRLRFQIEFNFRDAKQFWGLEDFMNVNQIPVYNAANLAMFMVNVSQVLIRHFRPACPTFSVNDLKAHFRGHKYVTETLKLLPQMPEPIFIDQIFANIAQIGSINAS